MVSVYPNPPPVQELYCYHTASGDQNLNINNGGGYVPDDPNKKVRKPYTISKSRESWTEQEHDKFLEALHLFDRDWKKIEAFVGSKTVIQIRSHAQKYFLKVQKSGASEHVPPPRPKRKAAHPYPQKASRTGPLQPSLVETGFVTSPNSSLPANVIGSRVLSPWSCNTVPAFNVSHVTKDGAQFTSSTMTQNCNSISNESIHGSCPINESGELGKKKQKKQIRVVPDFAQVYRFIGSVFDPNSTDHLRRLKEMDPINVETVLTLMKNLSANLLSSEFEDQCWAQRRLLSSYCVGPEKDKACDPFKNLRNMIPSM